MAWDGSWTFNEGALNAYKAICNAFSTLGDALNVTTPGGVKVLSVNFTRPADTTAYAANDLVGINTSVAAGNSPEVANAVRSNGDAFRIERVRLKKSDKTLTNANFRVHIFNAQPTWSVGDNGAGGAITALALSDIVGHVGYVDITMDRASATAGAYGIAVPTVGTAITVAPSAGTSFYFAIQALAVYGPASAEVFTVQFEGIRP